MKKSIKILLIILIPILLLTGVGVYAINRISVVELDNSDEALGIEIKEAETNDDFVKMESKEEIIEPEKQRDDIINIALFGLDRRSKKEVSRSDAIIILSIDFKHKKIKMSSLMRDIYVPIEGYKSQKLNHAYALGGAQLAVKTINQNFGTNIRHYASVDFFALEEIIDAIGGVELPVKEKEINNINKYIREVSNITKTKAVYLESGGEYVLTGAQALAYARIRNVGDGDFERTERQRRVLTQMILKGKEKGLTLIPDLVMKVLPLVETNLTKSEILELSVDYFKSQPMEIEQNRFPLDGRYSSDMSTGVWYLKVDHEDMKKTINEYIYEKEDDKEDR